MANEMAMLTEKRLKEMEAEMNRFEQEILTPKGSEGVAQGRIIIGSNTFHQVQAKITHGDGPPRKMARPDSHSQRTLSPEPKSDSNIPLSVLSAPPPPPPSLIGSSQPSVGGMPPMAPPPPPPSSSVRPSLSFVPPQIRHRNAPPPPPPRAGPPMHGPPRPPPYMGHNGPPAPPPGIHGPGPYGGPHGGPHGHPPPHMMHPRGPPMPGPYGGPHGPMSMGPGYGISSGDIHHALNTVRDGSGKDSEESATIEKPRVVYSSAPVIKTSEKKKKKKKDTEEKEKETSSEDSSKAADITESSVSGGITAGPAVIPTTVIPEAQDHLQEAEIETDTSGKKGKKDKKKKYIRTAAGQVWEDNSLDDWDTDDFRIFCGDLGNEVTDEVLARAFSKFPSFQKAKVVRDKRTNKTRGYGFVSFKDPNDFVQAMREMNGKYVGNRPIKLRKSQWKDRSIDIVRKKEKEKKRLGLR